MRPTIATAALALLVLATITTPMSIQDQAQYRQMIAGQGLYASDDDVQILTRANFNERVFRSNTAWLVEFYNSWCGFCQRFAPSWKALATDTSPWRRLVRIAAIDCSDDANSPLCREFEVMGYPTLRYFHEFYQHGIGVDVQKGTDMEELKQVLLRHMIQEQQQQGRGRNFPNLSPYSHATLNQLFSETNVNSKYAFLLIDAPNTLIGPQLELDFYPFEEIGVRYASANNTELIKQLGCKTLPAMVALSDRNRMHMFPEALRTREDFRQAIIDYVKPDINIRIQENNDIFRDKWLNVQVPDVAQLMQEKEKHAIRQQIKKLGDAVYQVDLETALRRSLKNEVAATKEISGEKLQALRAFVTILQKYFPFGPNGQIFLANLFNLIHSRSTIDGQEIGTLVGVNEADHRMVFSSKHTWIACEGSTSAKRGFPCGLWKLFHYLSVQAAANQGADPKEVLNAMHGYIKNFFGCADCSRHFQAMAARRDIDSVHTPNEAIMWLWSAHNEVNNRLAGDDTEDPEFPKVQFPTAENCALCRTGGEWNYPEVLRYLKAMYARSNIKYLGSDTRILHPQHDDVLLMSPPSSGASSVFHQIDASMCFILYVLSFVLILVLIRLFLKKGKGVGYRKKSYAHDLLGKV